jgi:parvulin-like peptidyl-prolyl isomerase
MAARRRAARVTGRRSWRAAFAGAVAALLLAACDAAPTGADAGAATTAAASAAPTSAPNAGAHGAGPSAAPTAAGAPSPGAPASTAAPTEVAAQHVLVAYKGAKNAPKSVTRSKADARKRAEEARTKATGGADFAKVVEEYSDDAVTRERLGSLGKFAHGGMVKPFADAAFALPVGGISEVVETDFGFHVIKRNQ